MRITRRFRILPVTIIVLSLLLVSCGQSGEQTLPPLFGETTAASAPPVTETATEAATAAPTETPTTVPETVPETEPTETEKTAPDDVQGEVGWSSGIMVLNGRVMEMFYGNEDGITDYADRINRFAAMLPAGVRMVSMVSPTAGEFYTPAQYHEAVQSQRAAIDSIYEKLTPGIVTVNAYHTLLQHTDEYIYFRTDHHWTGLGAYYGYEALMQALGTEPVPLSEYDEYQLEGTYLGTLYRFVQGNATVTNNPDTVYMYKPKVYNATAHVYNDFTLTGGYAMHLLANQFTGNEKYLSFSGGDAPVLQITSEIGTGKKVVVIKDSYANALVPHLANHYDEAYIIDPRAVEGNLIDFISTVGADDVIVMNYAFAYANPTWNSRFELLF
ncbi:MAG TPA: hypothetical protein GXZ64_02245 [Clostridiaceae bacterium]|jgi:hypothetical protein|nr:hypothetical protein [Clostridiaceae bacterium]